MTETTSPEEKVRLRRHVIQSFRARADAKRTTAERFADWLTNSFGTVWFLNLNALWFLVWIVINVGFIPGVEPFDPFPFGLLTMVVSLEAIFLAIIVLISQNRATRIAELREEVDLHVNQIAEEEIIKIIKLMEVLLEKNGIDVSKDPELAQMLRPAKSGELERRLEKELSRK